MHILLLLVTLNWIKKRENNAKFPIYATEFFPINKWNFFRSLGRAYVSENGEKCIHGLNVNNETTYCYLECKYAISFRSMEIFTSSSSSSSSSIDLNTTNTKTKIVSCTIHNTTLYPGGGVEPVNVKISREHYKYKSRTKKPTKLLPFFLVLYCFFIFFNNFLFLAVYKTKQQHQQQIKGEHIGTITILFGQVSLETKRKKKMKM